MRFVRAASLSLVLCLAWNVGLPGDTVQVFEFFPNTPIPDVDTIEVDFLVEPEEPCVIIEDIDVGLLIPHTWQGNLKITLTHTDTGTSTLLFDQPGVPQNGVFGFSADNYGDPSTGQLFFLDDEATEFYDSKPFGNVDPPGIESVTGSWLPEGDLSVFDGIDATGIWRLTIEDFGGGDVGTLEVLSFHIPTSAIPEPNVAIWIGFSVMIVTTLNRSKST